MYKEPEFRGLLLNLTDACNLACRYCFVEQNPHFMTLQVAKDAADLLVRINKPKGITPDITFFGGEPTLMWDKIIVPLVDYIENELKEPFKFNITSNCILLNEERLQFLKDHNINLLFSIDGAKETQDYNRPTHIEGESSFDILEPMIPKISAAFPNTTFRSTLIPQTCHNLFKNMMFAASQGFRNYYACPDDFNEWNEEHLQILEEELTKYALYFIDSFVNNRPRIGFSPFEEKFKYIIKHNVSVANDTIEPKNVYHKCGMGINYAAVNYEGKLFGCQELPSRGCKNNDFYIGDIYNGIDIKRHEKLINNFNDNKTVCSNPELCENCLMSRICQNYYCQANSYLIHGNVWTVTEIRCRWEQMLMNKAIFAMNVLGKNENEQFKKYFMEQVNG